MGGRERDMGGNGGPQLRVQVAGEIRKENCSLHRETGLKMLFKLSKLMVPYVWPSKYTNCLVLVTT